jgi:hypothetical protein
MKVLLWPDQRLKGKGKRIKEKGTRFKVRGLRLIIIF